MSLRIPEQFSEGFKILSNISLSTIKSISSVVDEIDIGTGPQEFKKKLESQFPDINFDEISNIIYSFGSITEENENDILEIAENLTKDFATNYGEVDSDFEQKLISLLKCSKNIKVTFKAIELISDNNIIFREGRVFSDIRILFNETLKNTRKRDAVIIHRLKLVVDQAEDSKNVFVSLDLPDLIELKNTLTRAIEKEKKIKSEYSELNFIEITK